MSVFSTQTLLLFAAGCAGTALAVPLGLPMPFMLGGIVGAGLAVLGIETRHGPRDLRLPTSFRMPFVALIGTMIGASFSPALMAVLPGFWLSALAVIPFIMAAHFGGYMVMRHLGGYRRVDALYAAMPGGLVEAVILGEKAGADPRVLAVQHFVRVILVVIAVPFLFWLSTGEVVGSAAGMTLSRGSYDIWDIAQIGAIALAGMTLGRVSRLPAGFLMGPLFLCALLQVAGVTAVIAPPWLLAVSQLVIGVGLGAQFSGLRRAVLVRGVITGIGAVGVMLAISFGFAIGLHQLVPADTATLFLSFSPGGVTEMNLIALSLNLSPVIVAVHHLIRIVMTVVLTGQLQRVLARRAAH
ncbi:MAG: AbrB family transcriptional regulator [Rhodobacter sp.]|nr:AbrB family transcriptional regulator [Rhodobacter sp.]